MEEPLSRLLPESGALFQSLCHSIGMNLQMNKFLVSGSPSYPAHAVLLIPLEEAIMSPDEVGLMQMSSAMPTAYTLPFSAAKEGCRNMVQFLLRNGANMYARNWNGQLPLNVTTDPQSRDPLTCFMKAILIERSESGEGFYKWREELFYSNIKKIPFKMGNFLCGGIPRNVIDLVNMLKLVGSSSIGEEALRIAPSGIRAKSWVRIPLGVSTLWGVGGDAHERCGIGARGAPKCWCTQGWPFDPRVEVMCSCIRAFINKPVFWCNGENREVKPHAYIAPVGEAKRAPAVKMLTYSSTEGEAQSSFTYSLTAVGEVQDCSSAHLQVRDNYDRRGRNPILLSNSSKRGDREEEKEEAEGTQVRTYDSTMLICDCMAAISPSLCL
eukprot:Gb_16600 [translate_table: standard]